ncbi:MAG TPA: HNH endonuclease signature motif containing protein, partial [Streptosporangiales bacterium]
GWLQACGEKAYRPGAWASIYTDPVEPAPGAEPQYRPSPRLERYVRARDRRCAFPGCTRRARRSDLDHTIPWPRGDTTAENLHPLCRRHHRLKTHSSWGLENDDDGTWAWTTPTGRRHTKTPYDYRELR